MTRDAELFFLKYIDYTPIKTKIEAEKDAHHLSKQIAIFSNHETVPYYVILSISDKVDKIVLENGAELADQRDLYRILLKDKRLQLGEPVFGDEILLEFLPAPPAIN